jgi:hypothetical protein
VTTILPPVSFTYAPGHVVKAYPYETKATSASPTGSYSLTKTEYRNFLTAGTVTNDFEYGFSIVSDLVRPDKVIKHLSTIRTYTTPFLLDQLPEKPNASWRLPIDNKESIDNKFLTVMGASNILQSTNTRNADGSYLDSGLQFDVPFTVSQKANGTGTLTIGPAVSPEVWDFSLPQPGVKGKIIPVIVSFAGKTGNNSVPDWYSGHGAPANPLTTQTIVDKGLQPVPTGCGKYAGKPAVLLHLTYAQLSTVSGYTFDQTNDYYVINKIGRVCLIEKFTQTSYDQKVTGKVQSVETFSSTAGLISESLR